MNWRKRRQVLYITAALVVVGLIAGYFIYSYVTTPGSCHDRTQDDGEQGADCGGPCARLCAFQARDPVVEFARALPEGSSTYTGVAYVKNPQWGTGAAAYGIGYTIRLLGDNNHLIIEQNGTVDLPAVETIPIIVPNIPTGYQTVAHAQFSFTTSPIVWTKIPAADRPTLTIKNQNLAPDGSRLSATVVNETNAPVNNLSVMATLFDQDGNAVAASRSVIQQIEAESQDDVVFTWPMANPGVVRAEIIPLPALPPNPQP